MKPIRPVEKVLLDTLSDLHNELFVEHPELLSRRESVRAVYEHGYYEGLHLGSLNDQGDDLRKLSLWIILFLGFEPMILFITLETLNSMELHSLTWRLIWYESLQLLVLLFYFASALPVMQKLWYKVLFGKHMTSLLKSQMHEPHDAMGSVGSR